MEYSKWNEKYYSIVQLLLVLELLRLSPATQTAGAGAAASPPQRPGCPQKCGNVDIPYPFGIGENCSFRSGFALHCDKDNGTYKPFTPGKTEVLKISLDRGQAHMKMGIASQRYIPERNRVLYSDSWANFTGSIYRFSKEANKFFVLGCNTLVYIIGSDATSVSGCRSTCNSNLQNCSCSGVGCCQVDLPESAAYYETYFNENYNSSQIWQTYNNYSYAAVIEAVTFNFSTTYVTSQDFVEKNNWKVPVVMDWAITNQKCEEAKNTTSYACVSSNSVCIYSESAQGYRCNCTNGYDGNPYLNDGCKDIDECMNTNPCPPGNICNNMEGTYNCSCSKDKNHNGAICNKMQPTSLWVMIALGTSIGVAILVLSTGGAYLAGERRKLSQIKQKHFQQHGGLLMLEEMRSQQGLGFMTFTEEELNQATRKFDPTSIIGQGGQGTVYKGTLNNNRAVAIKRCKLIDDQQKKQFGKEMFILSQINHKNIVKLLGCCLEAEVPILVYEFVPHGTLFELIHGATGCHITLPTRLEIAHESAEALAYLHSWASPPILHGDVKSSNILLDDDYTAKVSDFGASILAPTDEAQFVTLVQGTCGYLDPEYMQTSQLTDRSDVYSFGVVLLELITGKKAFNFNGPENERSLAASFLISMKEKKVDNILDAHIKTEENTELLKGVAELAKHCLEMLGENRPSMKEVAEELDMLRKARQHSWVQGSAEEMQSLLCESPMINAEIEGGTRTFSIEKEVVRSLESGR